MIWYWLYVLWTLIKYLPLCVSSSVRPKELIHTEFFMVRGKYQMIFCYFWYCCWRLKYKHPPSKQRRHQRQKLFPVMALSYTRLNEQSSFVSAARHTRRPKFWAPCGTCNSHRQQLLLPLQLMMLLVRQFVTHVAVTDAGHMGKLQTIRKPMCDTCTSVRPSVCLSASKTCQSHSRL